jgi:hypothetical protein
LRINFLRLCASIWAGRSGTAHGTSWRVESKIWLNSNTRFLGPQQFIWNTNRSDCFFFSGDLFFTIDDTAKPSNKEFSLLRACLPSQAALTRRLTALAGLAIAHLWHPFVFLTLASISSFMSPSALSKSRADRCSPRRGRTNESTCIYKLKTRSPSVSKMQTSAQRLNFVDLLSSPHPFVERGVLFAREYLTFGLNEHQPCSLLAHTVTQLEIPPPINLVSSSHHSHLNHSNAAHSN